MLLYQRFPSLFYGVYNQGHHNIFPIIHYYDTGLYNTDVAKGRNMQISPLQSQTIQMVNLGGRFDSTRANHFGRDAKIWELVGETIYDFSYYYCNYKVNAIMFQEICSRPSTQSINQYTSTTGLNTA